MEDFGARYDEKVREWVKMLSDKLEAQKDASDVEMITIIVSIPGYLIFV